MSELGKLQRKRKSLVKLAMQFSQQGIAHDPKFLPRSFLVDLRGKIVDASEQSSETSSRGDLA